jgi:hypothetical protein
MILMTVRVLASVARPVSAVVGKKVGKSRHGDARRAGPGKLKCGMQCWGRG